MCNDTAQPDHTWTFSLGDHGGWDAVYWKGTRWRAGTGAKRVDLVQVVVFHSESVKCGIFVPTPQVKYMLKEHNRHPNHALTIIGNLKGACFASWKDFVSATTKLEPVNLNDILRLSQNFVLFAWGPDLEARFFGTRLVCSSL